uniref:Nuclear hormone receptor family member nhr-20 (inferred by orthology to a C. elegans protein) n=1 Tax=Strongyloides venezuelensis TaxID=75913 RepID=A0A0K0FPQ4_STRVS
MDHVFVTLWLKAYKEGLLTFTNRNALSIYDKSFEYNDTLIPELLKEKFIYEPNKKIFHQIILPLSEMNLDIEEFVFLKTLTINSLSRCEVSLNGKKILNEITNELIKCLSEHYKSKNISMDRLGELILFISNFYTTFQMFAENIITIDTFKLFDIDNEIRETLKFSR